MKKYCVVEKFFNIDRSVKMPHSAGEAMKEAVNEINALCGEITYCHVSDSDNSCIGTIQIIYSVKE